MTTKLHGFDGFSADSSAAIPVLASEEDIQTLTLGELLTLAHLRFRANACEQTEIQAFGGQEQALVRLNVSRFKRLMRGLYYLTAGSLDCGGFLSLTAGVRTREQLLDVASHFSSGASQALIGVQFVVGKAHRKSVNLREYRNSEAFQKRLGQLGREAAAMSALIQTTVRGKWTLDVNLFIPCVTTPAGFQHPDSSWSAIPVATPRYSLAGTETVLIVDDNSELRQAARHTLEEAGYTVLEARDGMEAEATLVERDGEVDLVVLDLLMPGKHGGQVLLEMRQLFPDLGVVLSCREPRDTTLSQLLMSHEVDFLSKPYGPNELLSSVRRALDRMD